jgi:hypothetical protein
MSITPLSFPDFIDTTADEQRWQLFNSIASGIEISNDAGNPVPVIAVPAVAGVSSYYHATSAATTNDTLVATGARSIPFFSVYHIGTGNVNRFLKLYNKATTPTSSDTPILTLVVHPSQTVTIAPSISLYFNLGIGYRMTANYADNDNTAISANELAVNIAYI